MHKKRALSKMRTIRNLKKMRVKLTRELRPKQQRTSSMTQLLNRKAKSCHKKKVKGLRLPQRTLKRLRPWEIYLEVTDYITSPRARVVLTLLSAHLQLLKWLMEIPNT